MSSGLRLGLNVQAHPVLVRAEVATKLLGGSARHPELNSPDRPRGDLYDNIARLLFNAP
jgi:hypothetical protein